MKKIIVAVLCIVGMAGVCFGQQDNNDADKTLRGSGRVNPSTLAMEFDLPLGNYPGRGINVPTSGNRGDRIYEF